MRIRAMVVTLDPGAAKADRITETVTVDLPRYTDADWYLKGEAGKRVHRGIRERIPATRPGEVVGYALVHAADPGRDAAVREIALLLLDRDPECTETAIEGWPDAAKALVLRLDAEVRDVETRLTLALESTKK